MHERLEGADHETGADEQDQRKRHLNDNQGLAGVVSLAALAEGSAAFAEPTGGLDSGVFEDWDGADEEACEKRETEREKQNRNIDTDLVEARQPGGCGGDKSPQSAVGQPQANGCAGNAEDETLKEQLRRRSTPRRAERGTNGELLAAALHTHQQEIGHVRTRHHENQRDGAHENPKNLSDVADNVLLQGPEVGLKARFFKEGRAESVGRREAAESNGQQARHIGAGLLHCDAGLEPGQGALAEVAEFDFAPIPLEGND